MQNHEEDEVLDEHEGADAPAAADDDSVEEEAEDLDGEVLDEDEGEEGKGEEAEYEEYEEDEDEGEMEEYDEPPPDPPKKGGLKMDYLVIMVVMFAMTLPLLTSGGPRGPPRLGVFELDQVSRGGEPRRRCSRAAIIH